jgi:hypothetical protein
MADKHARNEEPWDPPTGMAKVRCARCGYWAAVPSAAVTHCRDCELKLLLRADLVALRAEALRVLESE